LRRFAAFALITAVLLIGLGIRLARAPDLDIDPRWYTLGSLDRELAQEKQTYDVVVNALGGPQGTFGIITEEHKAFLRAAFSRGQYDVLDEQPQLTLPMLGQALDALASKRPFTPRPALPEPRTEALGLPIRSGGGLGITTPRQPGERWGEGPGKGPRQRLILALMSPFPCGPPGPPTPRLARVFGQLRLAALRLGEALGDVRLRRLHEVAHFDSGRGQGSADPTCSRREWRWPMRQLARSTTQLTS
jgi:hypothetical protein